MARYIDPTCFSARTAINSCKSIDLTNRAYITQRLSPILRSGFRASSNYLLLVVLQNLRSAIGDHETPRKRNVLLRARKPAEPR